MSTVHSFFFVVLGIEPSMLYSQVLHYLSYVPSPLIVTFVFEIGSC
jgi:hypothetical protein